MNRKTITGIIVAISVLLNLIFLVFAVVQKAAADTARELAVQNEMRCIEQSRQFKAELDTCEGLRAQADASREECEQKVLAFSNRK